MKFLLNFVSSRKLLYTLYHFQNLHFGSAPTLNRWEILELRELSEPDVSMITTYRSLKPHLTNTRQHLCLTFKTSLQSRSNFGERVLSIFLAKIMTAIFGFHGSGRLGRERNLLPRR